MGTDSDVETQAQGSGKYDFAVLELITGPVLVFDKNLEMVFANEATVKLIGRPWEQLKGRSLDALNIKLEKDMLKVMASGQRVNFETKATIEDRCYDFNITGSPVTDKKGNVTGVIELIKDITEEKQAVREVENLVEAAVSGKLDTRGNPDKYQNKGFKEIIRGINATLDAVIGPLKVAADYVSRISRGEIPQKITDNYNGDFNEIKNSLNVCIDAVHNLIADAEMLTEVAVAGDLQKRADAVKHAGDFRKIIEGINATLDAVINPLNELEACLNEMATGNLNVTVKGDYQGDLAIIKDNLNNTIASINEILSQFSMAVDQVASGAEQIAATGQALSQGATESASSLEQITASIQELTSQTEQNAENATQAKQMATQARGNAEQGNEQMAQMVKAMNDINESAATISKIIKAIDEIAFQTNLLALNAAVEAARAGKHGKGFTVVAEEVRNLAQRSAAAAKETAELIEGSIKKTEVGKKIVEETAKALEGIVTSATKVTDLIGEIASASKEQARGIKQINEGLGQIGQVAQQITASSEESAAASEELSGQSMQLKEMLSKFTLRKRDILVDYELPAGITPQMIQMLKMMMQQQNQVVVQSNPVSSKQTGVLSKNKRMSAKQSPANVIALDDTEFGTF